MLSQARNRIDAFPHSKINVVIFGSLLLLVSLAITNTSCGGGTGVANASTGPNQGSTPIPVSSVSVSPSTATVETGQTLQLTAAINGTASSAVTWSANLGSVSSAGLFTAPSVSTRESATVTATSTADSTKKAVASILIVPQTMPGGGVNTENRFCGIGNVPRFPSQNDGPAQLPTSCYYTGMDGTPSPGKTWSGNDPNSLYAQARCGDVILLTAGQSVTENPNFPHKNCDDQHYITIRTSTPDAQLPPEGSRISPCFFGVASLPGRPAFPNCPARGAENLGFKIVTSLGLIPVFGDHLRFIGIEFAKPPGRVWEGLDLTGSDHIIFDRVWIHGNPLEESDRGVRLVDTQYVAVINSYINEFHCNTGPTGTCTDAHAVGGGGNHQTGTYHGTFKIYGNFLEGSGQSVLFGGGPSVDTSCDIDIEGNLLFKPLTWDPADPTYDGGFNGHPYIVKNHFELKNACRVLFRGNRLMNVWAGFSQKGASILLSAASQEGKCPLCRVHDVTVAYNYVTNAEQALLIANAGGGEDHFAYEGRNYSVHDLIADGLDFPTAYDPGTAEYKVEIDTDPGAPANDILANVEINHITLVEQAATTGGFLVMGGPAPTAETGIVVKNSVMFGGKYGVWSSGGTGNCANSPAVSPKEKFDACWVSPYEFTHNLILNGNAIPYDVWPAGSITDVTSQASTYENFNGGAFGDYHLAANSPGKTAADDGTDMGANVSIVTQEIPGIR